MKGPHHLRHVAFYTPEDVIVSPLHIAFEMEARENPDARYMSVMDAASQTLVRGRYVPAPHDRSERRAAAQWLLDIACARYACDARVLDSWI
jgi:hypothetical protein